VYGSTDEVANWLRTFEDGKLKVSAEIQNIVYYEWLPALGLKLAPYSGYKDNIAPRIFNEFSAAAFRMGHTLINSDIIRMTTYLVLLGREDLTSRQST